MTMPRFIARRSLRRWWSAPPEGSDWLHEIKFDGYRAIASVG